MHKCLHVSKYLPNAIVLLMTCMQILENVTVLGKRRQVLHGQFCFAETHEPVMPMCKCKEFNKFQ